MTKPLTLKTSILLNGSRWLTVNLFAFIIMLLSSVTRFKKGLRLGLTRLGFDSGDLVSVISIVCASSERKALGTIDPGQVDKLILKWRYLAQRAYT